MAVDLFLAACFIAMVAHWIHRRQRRRDDWVEVPFGERRVGR